MQIVKMSKIDMGVFGEFYTLTIDIDPDNLLQDYVNIKITEPEAMQLKPHFKNERTSGKSIKHTEWT